MAASNLALQEQLQEAHKANDRLNDELSSGRTGIEQQMIDMQERITMLLKVRSHIFISVLLRHTHTEEG